ncbi:hypothetical protein Acor_41020 [Acrocarpospora corrugata]|uniref:Uncharacterized protein n=1 Tax=Acrocarpospora corrugata TaxID=35763 RepID=A0A5M3VYT6_9ACTN|nr:hypothetical protein [Acrocarpospora corrugata]GES02037.1 hypothetical protein Acor_41020 [Acrocarpospora corrugata]
MSHALTATDSVTASGNDTRTSVDSDTVPPVPFRPSSSLPLDVAQHAFDLLMAGPEPLSIDGAELGVGLPARLIPLHELRAILLHPACSRTTRDEVWRHLICQARTHRKAWMVAAVALALPMLHRLTKSLTSKITADREDLEADVLACYMEAVVRVNLTWSHPVLRLSRLTQFAVLRAHATQQPELLTVPELGEGEQALSYPAGHADLLLAGAVASGVITAEEAELIGLTRLENIPLSTYCRSRGLLYCTILKRRQRAEAALYQALMDGDLGDLSTVR